MSNEVSGYAWFNIMELPAMRTTQPIIIGQNVCNNPCPIAPMGTWYTTTTLSEHTNVPSEQQLIL